MNTWFWITFWTLLPISELRGGLPYALGKGIPWLTAYLYCVAVNALVGPLAFLFLETLHKRLYSWSFYAGIFDRLVARARRKLSGKVDKWGFFGLVLFVGIPLPVTGAWTGTLGAWVLGLSRRKTILAILIGTSLAGLLVSGIIFLGLETFGFLVKTVGSSS